MESLVMRFVRAITGGENSPGDSPKLYIIIPRPHAYLADLLTKAFEGRTDVEIVADRRRGERRMQQQPAAVERRRGADRRRIVGTEQTKEVERVSLLAQRATDDGDARRT